ncbi:MAG: hypothetical protein H0U54_09895 [Acidobacteria bacterium]|nr:hypothetical protein [Acidobacteriota bacterium]
MSLAPIRNSPTAFRTSLPQSLEELIALLAVVFAGARSKEMAKRLTERQRLTLKLDVLNDTEVVEVLDYISIMESMRRATALAGSWEDDVVSILANAHENKRARQAFEWESVRRRAERRASNLPVRV